MTHPAPTLTTDHLVLRAHGLSDFADCAAMWADPVVVRYIGGQPFSAQQTWTKLLRYVGHWHLLGFGYWAIRDRGDDSFVGEAGFADFKRDIEPSFDGAPEIGWALAPHAHGRGLASEAVRAIVAWGDNHLNAARTVCMISPTNLASLAVARKCGYAERYRTQYMGEPTIIFSRPTPSR